MAKIIAEGKEEFSRIEKELQSLPEDVSAQIETAEDSLMGTQCTLREAYGDSNTVYLPHPIEQFMNYKDEDRAVCGEFLFIIPKKEATKIHYVATPVRKR